MITYRFIDLFIIFAKYAKLSLKITLEYKFDRVLMAVAIFCREIINVVVMYLLLTRFLHIKGWEMNELFFLYSFLFLSYSLFVLLFAGIREFDGMVYTGEFDRFLIRPLGVLFQLISSRIDFSATLGHGTVGVILFLNTAFSVGIDWTPAHIAYYLLALISGAVIQAAIFMLSACFSFWAIKIDNLRNLIFFNARRIAGYPISFYSGIIQKLLIFIVPFSFVNYFPAQYFIRKEEMGQFWNGLMYLPPAVALVLSLLVYAIWKQGLKNYSSSGNAM